MISRRNFAMISLIMLVLLGLFMFTEAAKQELNKYDSNPYTGDVEKGGESDQVYQVSDSTESAYSVYIGEDSSEIEMTVEQWSGYHHSNLLTYTSCEDAKMDAEHKPEFIVIQGSSIEESDVDIIGDWIQQGAYIIFADMPSLKLIKGNETLRAYLGISEVYQDEVELTGMSLREGFLIGGAGDYVEDTDYEEDMQDLDLTTPWYLLSSGTKMYLAGEIEDEDYKEYFGEDNFNNYPTAFLPGIIWRNSIDDARVFVVNGDYMKSDTGIGLLYAMEYEVSGFQIYPVVNAQSTVMTAYPTFASENGEQMNQIYSRDAISVLRDIVWPGLVEIMTNTNSRMTFMLQTRIDYSDQTAIDVGDIAMLMRFLGIQETEAGLSLGGKGTLSSLEQLQQDKEIYDTYLPDYTFQTAYIGTQDAGDVQSVLSEEGYTDVSTMLRDYEANGEIFSYLSDDTLLLSSINTGSSHTYSEDLRARSIETAFAYSLISEDLSEVIYPTTKEQEWQNLYEKLSSYCVALFQQYDAFDELTLSETSQRVRDYFQADYEIRREGKAITLTSAEDSGYFIFRTHGEKIVEIEGADYEKLEDDAYLISLHSKSVTITMDQESEVYYYEGN